MREYPVGIRSPMQTPQLQVGKSNWSILARYYVTNEADVDIILPQFLSTRAYFEIEILKNREKSPFEIVLRPLATDCGP